MSKFLITTTGTLNPVILHDLGCRSFQHPTVEHDLLLEYTTLELIQSKHLQHALTSGFLTAKDDFGTTITTLSGRTGYILATTVDVIYLSASTVVTPTVSATTVAAITVMAPTVSATTVAALTVVAPTVSASTIITSAVTAAYVSGTSGMLTTFSGGTIFSGSTPLETIIKRLVKTPIFDVDNYSANTTYIGYGTLSTALTITRVISTGSTYETLFAEGNEDFDKNWDNRYVYDYF